MRRTIAVITILAASFGAVFAQDKGADRKAAAAATAEAIKQMERDWFDAEKAADVDKLGAILAPDWRSQGPDGKISTKAEALRDLKEGKVKVESFEIGPMDVKVVGNVAICQGSDTEKSTDHGRDTSGKWLWTDVFAKRGDKWVAIRSQSAMQLK
jgi:ketosteroid isomerase-like protein